MPDLETPSSTAKSGLRSPLAIISSITESASQLTVNHYIRLVWIVGGYIFLRPYIERGFQRLFATQNEHVPNEGTSSSTGDSAVSLEDDDASGKPIRAGSNSQDTAGDTSWGSAARKRQAIIMKAWDKEQARLAAENDFDGIDPDLLED